MPELPDITVYLEALQRRVNCPGDMRDDWHVVTRGYTWKVQDYAGRITIGLGRASMATREAAEKYMREFNALNKPTKV